MRATARHGLIITGWELSELLHERPIMALAALFTFALPVYLAASYSASGANSGYIYLWALESAFAPIFIASMMMVQAFIADRDRGILPTLLATPISNLALFAGKALPIIALCLVQGFCGFIVFCLTLWLKRPDLLAAANRFALLLIPPMVVCTTLVVCGLGIIVVSRTRSPPQRLAAADVKLDKRPDLRISAGAVSYDRPRGPADGPGRGRHTGGPGHSIAGRGRQYLPARADHRSAIEHSRRYLE